MGMWLPGPLMIGSNFQFNLSEDHKNMTAWNATHSCYTSTAVNTVMENWYHANCS
jgi:hypothetical protein